ncbi:MAG: hypothetical protein D8B50_06265 [Prevotella sp.]|nr:MAG: hypothetical protein D8B50_06265 [Prevotella sp.]
MTREPSARFQDVSAVILFTTFSTSKLQKAEKAAKSKKRELQKAKKGGHTNVCPQHFSPIIAP